VSRKANYWIRSNIVTCSPTTLAEFNVFRKASAAIFKSFADLSKPPGILKYLGTQQVVLDLESIRSALGYEKINFLGAS
jgi:hypothetical protein